MCQRNDTLVEMTAEDESFFRNKVTLMQENADDEVGGKLNVLDG